eukprot:10338434-Alexandrium_andersonii.AAC.1
MAQPPLGAKAKVSLTKACWKHDRLRLVGHPGSRVASPCASAQAIQRTCIFASVRSRAARE